MTRIFRYILQTDNGMAPCIADSQITLATCKPRVRAGATDGDWVLGFYPRPFERGMLAWAGRVARKVEVGDYEREFRSRPDAVYRQRLDGSFRRLDPEYHPHPGDMRKDLSAPVLVFDPAGTWYFGDAPHMLPDHLMHLRAGGRGHRVSDSGEAEIRALAAWLGSLSAPGILGRPRHAPIHKQSTPGCGTTVRTSTSSLSGTEPRLRSSC